MCQAPLQTPDTCGHHWGIIKTERKAISYNGGPSGVRMLEFLLGRWDVVVGVGEGVHRK